MKRYITANNNNIQTLNFVIDKQERERYIHTFIGDLSDILNKKGIHIDVFDEGYSLVINIIGSSRKDVIDSVVVKDNEIIYDWDDVYFAASKIAEKIELEARI